MGISPASLSPEAESLALHWRPSYSLARRGWNVMRLADMRKCGGSWESVVQNSLGPVAQRALRAALVRATWTVSTAAVNHLSHSEYLVCFEK